MAADPIEIWKGNLSPSISDTIEINGVPFDLTGASVKFRMRKHDSATLKVDAAAQLVGAPTTGGVRYDWAGTDTDTAYEYRAWWHVTLASGKVQDTPEFVLLVLDHAPPVTTDLCTVDDVKVGLDIEGADRDGTIAELITQASIKIIDEVDREILPRDDGPTLRRFRVNPRRAVRGAVLVSLVSPRSDLRSVTLMRLHPETSSPVTIVAGAGGYALDPQQSQFGVYTAVRLSRKLSYGSDMLADFGFCWLEITGAWGFPSVPEMAKRACVLTVGSWLERGIGQLAEATSDPASLMPARVKSYAIPGDAKALLGRLYRARIF